MRKAIKEAGTSKEALASKKSKRELSPIDKRAQAVFSLYPTTEELFFTADGYAFFTNDAATIHASTLIDKRITLKTKK
jgi:hypothetical protein